LVAGEHVPDRFGESAGEVDLGDLGAALFADAGFGALIAVAVDRGGAGVDGGFHERPSQVAAIASWRAGLGGRTRRTGRRADSVEAVT